MAEESRNNSSSCTPKRRLKNEEYLLSFREAFLDRFADRDECVVYRTLQELPPTEFDQTPHAFRPQHKTGKFKIQRKYSSDEVAKMTVDKQLRAVSAYGLSVNDSPESAKNSFFKIYNKKKAAGASKEELEEYKRTRGCNIARIIVTKDDGLLTDFDDGHAELFLYENVELESLIDNSFSAIIEFDDDEPDE